MARPDRIEGLAIVSTDGMIADRHGVQPDALKLEADQRFFYATLDRADAVVHGRHSGEGGPKAPARRRLILTHGVPALARETASSRAVLWNPSGATLDQAWEMLGLSGGVLAVIGGTEPFGLFLQIGYDAFHLTRAGRAALPGGRPVFPGVPPRAPEDILAGTGLRPGPVEMLDRSEQLTLTTWRR